MAFFKKVACFTDIHFGMKGNSRVHNDDCEAFVYWFIEQAKAHGCEGYGINCGLGSKSRSQALPLTVLLSPGSPTTSTSRFPRLEAAASSKSCDQN